MHRYSTQELLEVSNKAPIQIREALSAETTISTITSIATNLKLHVDQIGLIAELNVQMLLGLVNPQEFLNELIAAKVPEKDAKEIMTEINQKIFVPLREQMRKGPVAPTEPTAPTPPKATQGTARPVTAPPPTTPAKPSVPGSYAPPLQSPKYFHLENKIPAPMRPNLGGSQTPVSPPVAPPINQIAKSPVARPDLRNVLATVMAPKTLDTRKLLEDHEEPHIEFAPPVPRPTAPPPANLPGALPPKFVPPAPLVPVKPYSTDPYREPIE